MSETPAWNHWFHCIGHTYGSWLPGDPRGFRTRHHRQHIDGDYKQPPPRGTYDALHHHAKWLMTRPAVQFSPQQRPIVLDLIVRSFQKHRSEIIVASLDGVHLHVLNRCIDDEPRMLLGLARKESAHYAREAAATPAGGLWAKGGNFIPISDRTHQLRVVNYILQHAQKGAAIWYFRDEHKMGAVQSRPPIM